MVGITRRSCSWCDTLNVMTNGPVTCCYCGHRADVCRLECDCPKCRGQGQRDFLTLIEQPAKEQS